jgi:hypothetical protein
MACPLHGLLRAPDPPSVVLFSLLLYIRRRQRTKLMMPIRG